MDQLKGKDYSHKKRRKKKDKQKEKYEKQGKYNQKHLRITGLKK